MTDDPLPQPEIIKRFPVLTKGRLAVARRNGEIDWVKGPRQKPFYTPSAVNAFIRDHLTRKCGIVPSEKQEHRSPPIPPEYSDAGAIAAAERI